MTRHVVDDEPLASAREILADAIALILLARGVGRCEQCSIEDPWRLHPGAADSFCDYLDSLPDHRRLCMALAFLASRADDPDEDFTTPALHASVASRRLARLGQPP